jgi:hypothetical protein
MKLTAVPLDGWGSLIAVMVDHRLTWPQAAVILGMLGALLAYRLLSEHLRRKTLTELVERSPGGTIIQQERGAGGPAMHIEIGERSGSSLKDRSV